MSKAPKNNPDRTEVIQVSITMERQLKERYAKLAVSLDLSFSQLIRYALRRVGEGIDDYDSIEKKSKYIKGESNGYSSVGHKKGG